jgi:hypothetical protein
MTLVMHPRRPRPARIDEYRLGFRLAHGLTPAQAARAERAPLADVEALLAQPDFQQLLETCREFDAMPADKRLAMLEHLALTILEHALARGDVRAALFLLRERRQGRNPATRLLSAPRPAAPPQSGAGGGGRGFRDGSVDAASRGGAVTRDELAAERTARAAAVAAEPASALARRPGVILPAIAPKQAQLPNQRPAVSYRLGATTGFSFHLGAALVGPTVANTGQPRWPAAL